jgi:hypothetical protein
MAKSKQRRAGNQSPPFTKEQGRDYLRRLGLYNQLEIRELRARTPDEHVDAFNIVMQTAEALGWRKDALDEKEEKLVRERWNRLRRQYLAKQRSRCTADRVSS